MKIIVGIYKITSPSGKIYIGQSWNVFQRFNEHKKEKRGNRSKICNSIKKYGFENHTFQILHELPKDINQSILDKFEQIYIDHYRNAGIILLNIREAGSVGKLSESTKRIIKHKRQFQITSEETRKKMSLKSKGNRNGFKKGLNPWNKGTKNIMIAWNKGIIGIQNMSQETKNKMRESASIGKYFVMKDGNIIGEFLSQRHAAKNLGVSFTTIKKMYKDNFSCKKLPNIKIEFKPC